MIEKRDPLNLTGKVAVVTGGGSGIGLALADEIVAMHSGELDIESQEGVGTAVTISIPVLQQMEAAAEFDDLDDDDEERIIE